MNFYSNSKALCHNEISKTAEEVLCRITIFLLEALCTHCSNSRKHVLFALSWIYDVIHRNTALLSLQKILLAILLLEESFKLISIPEKY